MRNRTAAGCATLLLTLAFAFPARADGPSGITVNGAGEFRVKPNRVDFQVTASGSAELAADAIVKYRDSVRRTTEAFEGLKIKNLKFAPGALSYKEAGGGAATGIAALTGRGAPAGKPKVQVAQVFNLSLSSIDQLSEQELMETIAKILDTAKDIGATQTAAPKSGMAAIMMASMGGGGEGESPVTFVYDSGDMPRQTAYERAFADAEANARRLAALAHAKLGPVIEIQELTPTSGSEPATSAQMQIISSIYGLDSGSKTEKATGVSAEKFEEIPVRVNLRVRFALQQ